MGQRRMFLDVIMTRRSIWDFKEGEIPLDDVERILRAGSMAPSPGNSQPWRSHVIQGKAKERLAGLLDNTETILPVWRDLVVKGFKTVPVVIAVENPVFKQNTSYVPLEYNRHDTATSTFGLLLGTAAYIENMLLAAHSLGYGSVWIGFPPILDVAKNVIELQGTLIAILPVGLPADRQQEHAHGTRTPVDVVKFYH